MRKRRKTLRMGKSRCETIGERALHERNYNIIVLIAGFFTGGFFCVVLMCIPAAA